MLIQRLQKWWIENPSLLTCVKTIQTSTYGIVLDCFDTFEIGLDFTIRQVSSHWITTIQDSLSLVIAPILLYETVKKG